MGTSAILSAWLQRREAAGAAVPHHFVHRQVIDWDQPERIAASLAAQIEAMFPALRDPEARPEGRLLELLVRVSRHLGAAGRLVILVDGLDETRAEPGDNPLPRFLPHEVPVGIRILCATRPTYPHLGWIEARSPAGRVDLDDGTWAASNEAVVRGFWDAVGPGYQRRARRRRDRSGSARRRGQAGRSRVAPASSPSTAVVIGLGLDVAAGAAAVLGEREPSAAARGASPAAAAYEASAATAPVARRCAASSTSQRGRPSPTGDSQPSPARAVTASAGTRAR